MNTRLSCLFSACGLAAIAGCGTSGALKGSHQDAYAASDPVNGSRLLLPGSFSNLGESRGDVGLSEGLAAPVLGQDQSLDLAAAGMFTGQSAETAQPQPVQPPGVQQAAQFSSSHRIVVYTALLRIVVGDAEASIDRAKYLASTLGGYVQEIVGQRITLRVPADRFEEAVAALEGFGTVGHRQLQAQDVTEEYVDLEARLKNAERVRDRLLALLEKAGDVKAMLEVEKELGRVNEEIERLTGKLNVLRSRVAFSSITVQFERVAPRATTLAGARPLPFHWLHELQPERLWR